MASSAMQGNSLCNKTDLLQLSQLCNLQCLSVDIVCGNQGQHPVSLELVSQMSALTEVSLGSAAQRALGA